MFMALSRTSAFTGTVAAITRTAMTHKIAEQCCLIWFLLAGPVELRSPSPGLLVGRAKSVTSLSSLLVRKLSGDRHLYVAERRVDVPVPMDCVRRNNIDVPSVYAMGLPTLD